VVYVILIDHFQRSVFVNLGFSLEILFFIIMVIDDMFLAMKAEVASYAMGYGNNQFQTIKMFLYIYIYIYMQ
jgi:hypothetical protein